MDLSPRQIIDEMRNLYNALTIGDIGNLRNLLEKPCPSVTAFPTHANAFRLAMHALDRAHAAPIPMDAYRNFTKTLAMYPEFEPFNTTYKIQHPRSTDTTFETYAAFILPHV